MCWQKCESCNLILYIHMYACVCSFNLSMICVRVYVCMCVCVCVCVSVCLSVCLSREEDPDDAPHGHITSLVGDSTTCIGSR